MGAKFTPGPWKVFYTRDGRIILGVGDKDGCGITDQGDVSTNDQGLWRSGTEQKANARLIAAAPDLLAALIGMLPETERDAVNGTSPTFVQCEAARAAIAKAVQP